MSDTKPHNRQFSLQSQLETLSKEQREKVSAKLECLSKQLSTMPWYGDTIHDGSRLAWIFATGDDNLDVEDIAHEMASVHYLHQQSAYPEMVQTRLRLVADLLHGAYPRVPWNVLWKHVRRFGVPIVKYAASIQQTEPPNTVPDVDDEAYNAAFEYGFDQGYDAGIEECNPPSADASDGPQDSWNDIPAHITSWADVEEE